MFMLKSTHDARIAHLADRIAALHEDVADLQEQVARLEVQCKEERERTDRATDRLLAQAGVAPVSRPVPPPSLDDISSLFEEDPTVVKELQEEIKTRGAASVLLEGE